MTTNEIIEHFRARGICLRRTQHMNHNGTAGWHWEATDYKTGKYVIRNAYNPAQAFKRLQQLATTD